MIFLYSFIPFAFLFIWMMFFAGRDVACSNCKADLPRFQSPRTRNHRQWWEGGAFCRSCGCDCDAQGTVVAADRVNAPAAKSKMVLLFAAAVISAMVLLVVLAGLSHRAG